MRSETNHLRSGSHINRPGLCECLTLPETQCLCTEEAGIALGQGSSSPGVGCRTPQEPFRVFKAKDTCFYNPKTSSNFSTLILSPSYTHVFQTLPDTWCQNIKAEMGIQFSSVETLKRFAKISVALFSLMNNIFRNRFFKKIIVRTGFLSVND